MLAYTWISYLYLEEVEYLYVSQDVVTMHRSLKIVTLQHQQLVVPLTISSLKALSWYPLIVLKVFTKCYTKTKFTHLSEPTKSISICNSLGL